MLKKTLQEIDVKKGKYDYEAIGKSNADAVMDILESESHNGNKIISDHKIITHLIILMKRLSGFHRFITFNSIDDNVLRMAMPHVKLIKLPANSVIFTQGDPTMDFFCILKGKISIRAVKSMFDISIKKLVKAQRFMKIRGTTDRENLMATPESNPMDILSPVKSRIIVPKFLSNSPLTRPATRSSCTGSPFNAKASPMKKFMKERLMNTHTRQVTRENEVERLQMGEGMCFGEWGILYDIPRTASAYTLEDTLLKCLIRAENERKKFILKKIPSLGNMPSKQFDDFYRDVIITFYKNRDIIYLENEPACAFYLIYEGTCTLEKSFNLNNTRNTPILDKKLNPVLTLDCGDMPGLESLLQSGRYEYNLLSASSNTVIFKFELAKCSEYVKNALKTHLIPCYQSQKEIYKSIINRRIEHSLAIKDHYRNLSHGGNRSKVKNFKDLEGDELRRSQIKAEEELFRFKNFQKMNKEKLNMFVRAKKLSISKCNDENPNTTRDFICSKKLPSMVFATSRGKNGYMNNNNNTTNKHFSFNQIYQESEMKNDEGLYAQMQMQIQVTPIKSFFSLKKNLGGSLSNKSKGGGDTSSVNASSFPLTTKINSRVSMSRDASFEDMTDSLTSRNILRGKHKLNTIKKMKISNKLMTTLKEWKETIHDQQGTFATKSFRVPLYVIKTIHKTPN